MIERQHGSSVHSPSGRLWRYGLIVALVLMENLCRITQSSALADERQNVEFFEKEVRPVLVAKCQECHGATLQEGKLRLDSPAGWKSGGSRGPAVVPGKLAESLLITAIGYLDPELQMPPEKALSAHEVSVLKEWVARGAVDPRQDPVLSHRAADEEWEQAFQARLNWWSLQPRGNPLPPESNSFGRSSEPVDRFLRAPLAANGLTPASPAEPEVLLRRLSFVLTGLPPSPAVRDSYLRHVEADASAAYAELIDELLASSHFGEHFARHWMDVVRYTDTYGYESDNPANGAYEYRDYLIRAFNQDIPFDQLLREQLAGDLLPEPRLDPDLALNESAIGPMFYHLGEHREGGSLMFNGIHQQMVDNKIDAFSKAFLATTVACSRCHDHKLEAVSQRDYYQLAAVFMTPRWTSRVIDAPGRNTAAILRLKELRAEIRGELSALWSAAAANPELWTADRFRQAIEVKDAPEPKIEDIAYPMFKLLKGEGEIADRWNRLAAEWKETREKRMAANAQLQVLADFREPNIPNGWVMEGEGMEHGYVAEGTPLVSLTGPDAVTRLLERGFHTHALSSKLPGALRSPALHAVPAAQLSVQLEGGDYAGFLYVQGNGFKSEKIGFFKSPIPAWKSFADETLINGVPQVTIEFATTALNPNFPPRIGLSDGLPPTDPGYDKRSWMSITGIVSHETAGSPADTLEQFAALYEGSVAPPSEAEAIARLQAWFIAAVNRWCADQSQDRDVTLFNWMLSNRFLPNQPPEGSRLAALVEEYRRIEAAIPFARTVTGMDERELTELSYPINVRGDVDVVGELVKPDFLRMFAGQNNVAASDGSGRLELAEFLLHPDHPLTARVYVNRIWQWIYGDGLVSTPDDFGHLGDRPSHPELLDYLANEFIRNGWSTKSLIRRLVMSDTFRQSGHVAEKARRLDPANRLRHHYPTRRLEAESIRDALLAVSGRFDPILYGRPINPPRTGEDKLHKRLFSGPMDGYGRRSMYLLFSIMEPPKFLVGFNLPDLKLPTGKRDVTNVPGQALTMMNDPYVLAMSQYWAARLITEPHPSPEERVSAMLIEALGRQPTDGELTRWLTALHDFRTDGQAEILRDEAAWARLAHAMFNLKEFIYYR